MKRTISVLFVFSFFAFVVMPTSAQIGSNSPQKLSELSQAPVQTTQQTPATQTLQRPAIDRSAGIQTRALNEINRRVTALTNVLNRVNAFENLSTDTKTVLTTQIQQEIDDLTSLGSQIQSETDQAVIQELSQTVVTSYGTYAVFLPKVRVVLAGEGINMLSEKMLNVSERVAAMVAELELEGVDTSQMEQSLIDVEESVIQAQTNATEAINLVTPLSPDEYPNNRSVFQNARTLLRDARLSLVSARDSLGDIITSIQEAQTDEEAMMDAMESDPELTEEITNQTSPAPSTFNVQTTN